MYIFTSQKRKTYKILCGQYILIYRLNVIISQVQTRSPNFFYHCFTKIVLVLNFQVGRSSFLHLYQCNKFHVTKFAFLRLRFQKIFLVFRNIFWIPNYLVFIIINSKYCALEIPRVTHLLAFVEINSGKLHPTKKQGQANSLTTIGYGIFETSPSYRLKQRSTGKV